MGQLPNRVFMVLVDDNEYRGSIEKNPFNSKHFNASQVGIYLNVEMPCPPLKLNFTDNQYINGYRSLLATAGRIDTDNGFNITKVDYKSDCCIFKCNTSPTLYHGEPQERKRRGTLRANIEFRTPLPNSINVIMYMEFDKTFL